MRVSREFKMGILVVLSLLLFFISFNYVKSLGTFGKPRTFYAEFDGSYGLEPFDDVLLNGLSIGTVSEVELGRYDARKIIVKFSVNNNELVIPKTSQLWLISSDILGTKVLDLRIPNDSLWPADYKIYEDGDTFKMGNVFVAKSLDNELEALFLPIKDRTNQLIERVEDIVLSVNAYWDSSAAYTFDESMYDSRDAIERYKEMSENLTRLVKEENIHLNRIKKDVKLFKEFMNNTPTVAQISSNFNNIFSVLSDTTIGPVANRTSNSMKTLGKTMNDMYSGEGSFGKLVNTNELSMQIKAIDSSLTDLKDHLEARPKDFIGFSIFGLKAEGFKPSKDQKIELNGFLDSLENGNN